MGKLRTGSVHRNGVQTCADIRIPDGGHEACRERIVCISEEQGAFPDGCTQKNIPDAAKRKDVVARRGRESPECLPLSPMSSTLAVRSYFVLLEGMRDAPGCRLAYNPRAVLRQRMVHEHCSFMSIFCWFARCDSNSAERIDRWWILLQVAQARCDPILEHSSAKKKREPCMYLLGALSGHGAFRFMVAGCHRPLGLGLRASVLRLAHFGLLRYISLG